MDNPYNFDSIFDLAIEHAIFANRIAPQIFRKFWPWPAHSIVTCEMLKPIPELEDQVVCLPLTVIGYIMPHITQIFNGSGRIDNLRHTP